MTTNEEPHLQLAVNLLRGRVLSLGEEVELGEVAPYKEAAVGLRGTRVGVSNLLGFYFLESELIFAWIRE